VRRVLVEGGRVTGVEAAANVPHAARHTLYARVVIAADGRYSRIVRQTGRVVARGPRLVGFKWHRSGVGSPHTSDNAIEMVSFPGGYLGLCQVEDGQQNICGVMPRAALRRARGSIAAALQALTYDTSDLPERGGTLTMPDVRQQRASPLAAGVLYVGDAAETIEPLAGQGLAMAIAGGHLAAEVLLENRRHEVDAALQHRYAERCRRRFGPTIGRAQRLGWLLRRPALLSSLAALAPASACLEELLLRACYRWTRVPQSHLLTR
jgi:flavin-dependent dehydrogenase